MKKQHFPFEYLLIFVICLCFTSMAKAQKETKIPKIYSNIYSDKTGNLLFKDGKLPEVYIYQQPQLEHGTKNFRTIPTGNTDGLFFNFNEPNLGGYLYVGLFPYGKAKFPLPVYKSNVFKIEKGKAFVDLKHTFDRQESDSSQLRIGYRIISQNGDMLYDGKANIGFNNKYFSDICLSEGPFVTNLTSTGATICFRSDRMAFTKIVIDGKDFNDRRAVWLHKIEISGLKPDTKYKYSVEYGKYKDEYELQTAPEPKSGKSFVFAYTSDSRSGPGGGERNIYGVNAYVMKKIAALSQFKNARFIQFTGDLISGYTNKREESELELLNWKSSISPFAACIPFYVGMGNHEIIQSTFSSKSGKQISVDCFPFATHSAEACFADAFNNPSNGPKSEDGSVYDPDSSAVDFPTYNQSVYYYTYSNLGMIVLNSDYWYNPSEENIPKIGGNLHGYIMDNQLAWLKKTIEMFEKDSTINHVFVTLHTPAFPNGGHSDNDMWYNGNNNFRPYVSGKPVKKGIIERRDEILDILSNKSSKVVAILCGDEHNYSRMKLTSATPIYPENYKGEKISILRPIWQITNGSAGAPNYEQEKMPWSRFVEKFTTQFALAFFHIDGEKVTLEVINPDTLETIEEVELK